MQALFSLSSGSDAISKKLGQGADYLVLFCALISAGKPFIGMLFAPARDEEWSAVAGQGALLAQPQLLLRWVLRRT